jgi:hypothetical protein
MPNRDHRISVLGVGLRRTDKSFRRSIRIDDDLNDHLSEQGYVATSWQLSIALQSFPIIALLHWTYGMNHRSIWVSWHTSLDGHMESC